MRRCLFCPSGASSHEHVIPAALGGNDCVKATCVSCNTRFGQFEDEFTDRLLPFRQIAHIPNRRAKAVPSAPAILESGENEERAVRHPDGEISIRNFEHDKAGKVISESLRTTSAREVEAFKRRARAEGKKLVAEPGEFVTFAPVFKGTFHFLAMPAAFRTAAKAAYICLARQSRHVAKADAFRNIRSYIDGGDGDSVRLFFNASFAEGLRLGIHEHQITVVLDGLSRKVYGIVVFMGALHYLVDLSDLYIGADYEFTYRVNARTGASNIVNRNERQALNIVLGPETKWNAIAFSGGYFGTLVPENPAYKFSLKPV